MRIALNSRVLLLTLVCTPGLAWGADTWTDPYPGVRHLYRTTGAPNRIHVLTIDLTRADIRLRATRYADRQRRTSSFASLYDTELAVNGDFFSYATYSTSGLSVGGGERWTTTSDGAGSGFLAVGLDNRAEISRPGEVVDPPEDWMHDVVSGHPLLVENGVARDFGACTGFCARNPRTAAGLSEDGTTLILAVVDGRSSVSAGMSLPELAALMIDVGAYTALNLDGGGSSTLVVRNEGGVQNRPSDGSERVVANHLGVAIVSPFGTVKGFVREGDVYDTTAGIEGAMVSLSTGAGAVTDADGYYEIAMVPAGAVSITATAPGLAGERMIQVYGEETTWGSVAVSSAPPPDAGDPEPGDPDPDPSDPVDPDAASGGCRTSSRGGSGGAWLALLWLFAHARVQLGRRGGSGARSRRRGSGI